MEVLGSAFTCFDATKYGTCTVRMFVLEFKRFVIHVCWRQFKLVSFTFIKDSGFALWLLLLFRVHTVMKSHEKSWNLKMHFPGLEKSWNLGKMAEVMEKSWNFIFFVQRCHAV